MDKTDEADRIRAIKASIKRAREAARERGDLKPNGAPANDAGPPKRAPKPDDATER